MSPSSTSKRKLSRNALIGLIGAGVAVAMVGAAYAAVPLYKTFCQLTGFDGTIRKAESGPNGPAIGRTLTVKFDTNVRGLPWTFRALQRSQEVQIGAPAIAFFEVTNDSDKPITGRATYNLVPETAASYFLKTQCFCFDDQTIQPGATMKFPVVYYVEKEFATDSETRNFQELTLSYTFFPKPPNG
jgi:cytochrome c oxidase assembly protein subunit 11